MTSTTKKSNSLCFAVIRTKAISQRSKSVDFKPIKKSKAKYKVVHYYERTNKINHVDVWFAKSGLMHRRIFLKNKESYETYEYVFYNR